MKCPRCGREINLKKYQVYQCPCGRKLMLIEINKVKYIEDVTPEKEVKHERN